MQTKAGNGAGPVMDRVSALELWTRWRMEDVDDEVMLATRPFKSIKQI